jgi:hypothetical protein
MEALRRLDTLELASSLAAMWWLKPMSMSSSDMDAAAGEAWMPLARSRLELAFRNTAVLVTVLMLVRLKRACCLRSLLLSSWMRLSFLALLL